MVEETNVDIEAHNRMKALEQAYKYLDYPEMCDRIGGAKESKAYDRIRMSRRLFMIIRCALESSEIEYESVLEGINCRHYLTESSAKNMANNLLDGMMPELVSVVKRAVLEHLDDVKADITKGNE